MTYLPSSLGRVHSLTLNFVNAPVYRSNADSLYHLSARDPAGRSSSAHDARAAPGRWERFFGAGLDVERTRKGPSWVEGSVGSVGRGRRTRLPGDNGVGGGELLRM